MLYNKPYSLGLALALALLLVGCGSSSEPDPWEPPIEQPEPEQPIEPEEPEEPTEPEEPAEPEKPVIEFSNAVLSVFIDMHDDDLAELYSREVTSDDRLPARIRIDDWDQEWTGDIRFRGNSTRLEPKKAFNIRFDEGDQDFLWTGDRFNARSMWRDPSLVRENLSFWLFREYDIMAPRTLYMELFLNDVFEGFYSHFERIDRRFLRERNMNRDGTMVRDEFRSNTANDCGVGANRHTAFANNNWGDLTREQALECIQSKFDDTRVDWDEVLDFILWVDGSSAGNVFANELAERVDVDAMIRFFGVHVLIGDRDSLWGDDYWWYKDHEDPDAKWLFVARDKNLTFGSHWRGNNSDSEIGSGNLFFPYEYRLDDLIGENRLFQYFINTPVLRQQVESWVLAQIDSPIFLQGLDEELEKALEITTAFAKYDGFYEREFELHPGNYFNLYDDYPSHVEQVLEFRNLRRNYLRQALTVGFSGNRHDVHVVLNQSLAPGDKLWLVDNWGFTLGRFIPDHALAAGTEISLTAIAGDDTNPINKDWQLISNQPLEGKLSVYYRNDYYVVGSAPQDSNWYTGDEHASIGRQPEIQLVGNDEVITLSNSEVKPLINRIDADIIYTSGSAILSTRLP